jgi:hypothetical protein
MKKGEVGLRRGCRDQSPLQTETLMKFSNGARALSGEAQVVPVVLSFKEMKEKVLA